MKKLDLNEEQSLTNKLIELHKKKIEDLIEKEKTIEERYKKMMDEELSDITREKTRRLSIIESLSSDIESEEVPDVKEDVVVEEKKEEVEPKISDTLFPENNEITEEAEKSNPIETTEENKTEETPVVISEDEVISQNESEFDFGDDAQSENTDKQVDDDEWVDTPTEWN